MCCTLPVLLAPVVGKHVETDLFNSTLLVCCQLQRRHSTFCLKFNGLRIVLLVASHSKRSFEKINVYNFWIHLLIISMFWYKVCECVIPILCYGDQYLGGTWRILPSDCTKLSVLSMAEYMCLVCIYVCIFFRSSINVLLRFLQFARTVTVMLKWCWNLVLSKKLTDHDT